MATTPVLPLFRVPTLSARRDMQRERWSLSKRLLRTLLAVGHERADARTAQSPENVADQLRDHVPT